MPIDLCRPVEICNLSWTGAKIFSCADYVNNNPSGFVNAYFDFTSVRVYSLAQGVTTQGLVIAY